MKIELPDEAIFGYSLDENRNETLTETEKSLITSLMESEEGCELFCGYVLYNSRATDGLDKVFQELGIWDAVEKKYSKASAT